MKSIVIDIISGIVVPIATLYVGYKININHIEKKELKEKKEKIRELEIDEARATKKAVERFSRKVIGQYIDILNDGRAYDEFIKRAKENKTVIKFIDLRSSFEEDNIYSKCGKWDHDYVKIKNFYDHKVYGQYNGPDYVFAKDYLNLIRELKLDDEMENRRSQQS